MNHSSHEGFADLLKEWWPESQLGGCGAFILSKKLLCLKKRLKLWPKHTFGAVKECKMSILHSLESLDITREARNLSPEEIVQES